MENQLYVRIRGRVLGPYDKEKMQSLARRGQLSRMHELSTDATNWVRASAYPELFVSEEPPPAAVAPNRSGEARVSDKDEGLPPRTSNRSWWYGKNGSEFGPVDQATLQQMLASGNLGPDDVVWTDGMNQWGSARQTPGLMPISGSLLPASGGAAGSRDDLLASLCKVVVHSRAWVLFIAVVSFIYAALVVMAGIFELIYGARDHAASVVASGLFMLIFGMDVAAGGVLLATHASRIGSLRYGNSGVVLEKAFGVLHNFWVYVSINLIVFLTFLVVLAVWIVSVGGVLPWS
jgi:hypothetical protein